MLQPSMRLVRRRLGARGELARHGGVQRVVDQVLLPEPDTPVTQVNRPTGKSTVTF
jgi:hypothetical protein